MNLTVQLENKNITLALQKMIKDIQTPSKARKLAQRAAKNLRDKVRSQIRTTGRLGGVGKSKQTKINQKRGYSEFYTGTKSTTSHQKGRKRQSRKYYSRNIERAYVTKSFKKSKHLFVGPNILRKANGEIRGNRTDGFYFRMHDRGAKAVFGNPKINIKAQNYTERGIQKGRESTLKILSQDLSTQLKKYGIS